MVRNRRPPLPPPRDLHRPLLNARATQSLSPTYSSPEVASSPGYDELDPSLYLNDTERWWRDHQPWLEQSGYLLRARYRPDWVPSWEGKGFFSKLHVYEDMVELPASSRRMHATRLSDGSRVHLYRVFKETSPEEVDIMHHLAGVKENHTIPILEVLKLNRKLRVLVVPSMRSCDDPWFENVGAAVGFLSQALEGIKSMHAHGIAHRSPKLSGDAIVYDPRASCHPKDSHPAETEANPSLARGAFGHSRTERDGTYYFADFHVAKRYHAGPTSKHKVKWADETTVMDYPFLTGNHLAPEFRTPENKCDPFKVDVYLLGDEIFRCFFQKYRGFDWLKPLVDDMCREDPKSRITAEEAYVRFLWLSASLDSSLLCGRLISRQKRDLTRRVIRKCGKELHIRRLLRELGLRDVANPSLASWLPVHAV
ncbi:hypothetical protein BJ322DRAFT_1215573 [Thelephora terrestris]|uniref:Protein kinase domain-containing protein n=1 Tax=Thelephora terrestris TaxID=56493 RepID=A0A9P6HQ92_9AGAM|nr:hypothetical protein BJ322DRAFT_1215573 [Thelephora terrestris]